MEIVLKEGMSRQALQSLACGHISSIMAGKQGVTDKLINELEVRF